ncbi:50S ribosomal protein L25/general stress protein Ctc [Caldichromatium japonicum]|uniref:Large ribosomal subunit protein bL25 n=1 Tax=Caldichromatium japonicum TaxID=2699430 RepID=A0A6G7VBL7_9GAMM|nr:50S ribosomal protein L25/general stress protein Ctc [Caldichromatium japonicum]QIK37187.1 50S ribosomal protein L25/general stress protein Ctc [Caldichromatium japonicum]
MTISFEVNAQPRIAAGKGASRRLRRAGLVPAIVYGGHREPQMVSLSHNELLRHLEQEAFYSHILDLKIGDEVTKVVLKDLQRHPAKPFILHLDFMRISQDEKIRMTVPLHFINEDKCKGIKMGGQAFHLITEIEVICLPKDLPEFIAIDMTDLEVGSILHLSEIKLPEGVALAHAPDPDEPVVTIHGPRGSTEEGEGAA